MCVGTTRPQQWLQDNAVGGTMPNLNTSILARLPLWLPSRKEQDQAVSAITTIADTALTLERLIAKKRAIKQGMMQELLTGRTRLPGFDQPWRKTTLGEISRIKTGSRNNQDKREDGEYPFFVRSAQVERIDTYSYDCEAILVPGEGGIGSIFHYVNGKFEVHQRVYTVSDFVAGVSGKFVFYFMHQFFGQHAMENSVKATVDSLRLPTFKSFQLYLPNQHSEQETIVRILDEVDAEIDALEQSLRITRGIKQGMMQELLTGRTRLPVEEVAQ